MNDHEILKGILRQDLSSFIQKAFQTVSPGDVYRHNWHVLQEIDRHSYSPLITQ